MLVFLANRLVRALLTLLGVLAVAFVLLRLDGDPAALMLGPESTAAQRATLAHAYGFDKSIPLQFVDFLTNAVQGDFGNSIARGRPALQVVLERLPSTLKLAFSAFAFGLGLAMIVSLLAQLTGSRRLRSFLMWFGALTQSVPTFLLGIVLVLVFAVHLAWLPSVGSAGISHLILPTITLGIFELSLYNRLLSVAFAEQERMDYVRTARSKGQRNSVIVLRHMLPNAVLPLLTVAGVNLATLIGGTVVVESVFAWGGAGSLIQDAVNSRDYPVVQVGLLIFALFFVVINVLVDALYAVLDPRVRLR